MSKKRNIVLMSIDDGIAFWRYRHVFGTELLTPNLNRIFDAATAFTSAYCQVPICGPSRASALSGLSPMQTGIVDNYTRLYDVIRPDHLWQFKLREQGYHCSTAGKVHHAFGPQPPILHDTLYAHPPHRMKLMPPNKRHIPTQKLGGMSGGGATLDPKHDGLYYDKQSADNAIAFLQDYDMDAPFYREVGFLHPHLPYKTPLRFKELYDEAAFTHPKEWARGFGLTDFAKHYINENFQSDEVEYWRKSIRNYFSCYSHVDEHIGRVWDALQASPHADNTVFILFSDHGYHLGDKNRFRKSTLWEESTRVPLLIWDPTNPGGVVDDPVGLIDIGPTILDYAECAPLKASPGRSLRPAVVQKSADPDRGVPSFQFGSVGMRYGPWRIILYPNGETEFHDVEQDMWLTENLAHRHPDYKDTLNALVSVSADWGLDISSAAPSRAGVLPAQRALSFKETGQKASQAKQVFSTDQAPAQAMLGQPGDYTEFITAIAPKSTLTLSSATRSVRRGSDGTGNVELVHIRGNQRDNDIMLIGSGANYKVRVDTGPGNNHVQTTHEELEVHCGTGNNTIMLNGSGVIYGGSGSDILQCDWEMVDIHAGSGGDNQVITGEGETRIFSGHGRSKLECGTGKTEVVIEGGVNDIDARKGKCHLRFLRTGLPQKVQLGDEAVVIDFADWQGLGPVTLSDTDTEVIAQCGTERVVFTGQDRAAVTQAISNIDLAP